jgi:hypothetical protein
VKLTTHLYPVPRSRMVDLCHHSPLRLHGIVLNYVIKYRKNLTFIFYLQENSRLVSRIGRDRFLPYLFRFTIHHHPKRKRLLTTVARQTRDMFYMWSDPSLHATVEGNCCSLYGLFPRQQWADATGSVFFVVRSPAI